MALEAEDRVVPVQVQNVSPVRHVMTRLKEEVRLPEDQQHLLKVSLVFKRLISFFFIFFFNFLFSFFYLGGRGWLNITCIWDIVSSSPEVVFKRLISYLYIFKFF